MARLPYLKRDEVPEDDGKFFDLTVTSPTRPGHGFSVFSPTRQT